jgi:hypothetical protein
MTQGSILMPGAGNSSVAAPPKTHADQQAIEFNQFPNAFEKPR